MRLSSSRALAPLLAILSLLFLAGCAAAGGTSLGSLAGTLILLAGLALATLGIQGCGGGASTSPARLDEGGGGAPTRRIPDFPGRHTGLAGRNFQVAVGDLDGDGFPDAVSSAYLQGGFRVGSANGGTSAVVVNRNNTRGGLQVQGAYATGGIDVLGVEIGDLDGDGDPDIVAANDSSDDLSVFLNQGDGTFGAGALFPAGNGPVDVALGDVDGDGDLDAVLANFFGTLSVLEGDGAGNFGLPTDVPAPLYLTSVALGDLDGDGDLDVAGIAYDLVGTVSVFENVGGDLSSRTDFPGVFGSFNLALGDLDGDGDLDLATDSYGSDAYAFFNDGTGGFGSYDNFYAYYPQGVALGDMDGDGDLDLVTGSLYGGDPYYSASVLPGDGNGSFGPAQAFLAGKDPRACALADADGDGNLDVFLAEIDASSVAMIPGLGDGTLEEAPACATYDGAMGIAAGDLDGDGDLDLAVADGSYGYSSVALLFNDGAGGFTTTEVPLDSGAYMSVALGDVDGDGDLDVVLTRYDTTTDVVAVLNDGGTFATFAYSTPGYGYATSTALGDLDGDGDLDLVTTSLVTTSLNGAVVVSAGQGDGTFTNPLPLDTYGNGTCIAALGDLDGDGDLDIVAASDSGLPPKRQGGVGMEQGGPYGLAVFLNQGAGQFGPATVFYSGYGPFNVPKGLVLGDLDGDGDLDIAVTNGADDFGLLRTLLGDGTGGFTEGELSLTGTNSRGMAAGDLDGDGLLDLVVACDGSEDNSVLLGRGDGTFQAPFGFGSASDPQAVAVGDFNGDGRPDFASTSRSGGRDDDRDVEVFLQR